MTVDSYLNQLCQHLGLSEADFSITVTDEAELVTIQLDIPDDDVGLFIGHRGETLASLQRLTRIVFREEFADKIVRLNVNDYRQERNEQLEERLINIVARIRESGDDYRFPFLSSYERFVIHSLITNNEAYQDLESLSEGEGEDRRLIIKLKRTE